MNDKHDPNASVPIGTFKATTATTEDGEYEIPIEIVSDDDYEPDTLAIQSSRQPTRGYDEHTPAEVPRRKRVQTLMGVAMPGATLSALPTLPAAHDPTKATSNEISAAIDDVLDEQPTSIYGHTRESGGLRALESMLEAQMIELPQSNPPGEIVGVVGRETDTGTFEIEVQEDPQSRKSMPVLAPKQFVEARARDARDAEVRAREVREAEARAREIGAEARDDDARSRLMQEFEARAGIGPARSRTEPQPSAASTSGLGDIPTRNMGEPRTPAPNPATAPAARSLDSEPPAPKPAVSSLAPTEIPKRARTQRPQPRDSSLVGYGLVAAMVLLGIGGWFLTAGGYRRGGDAQASQPMAAASIAKPAVPADSLAAPKVAAVEPATSAPLATPSVESPAPTPPPVAPATAGKPKVAAKSVKKKVAPPPARLEDGVLETPSRDDVRVGLDRVRSSVQACAEGRNGVAEVDLTIAANGVVTNALVGGDFRGTPQGSCIARAVRQAKFPTFKQDRYRVLFPYVL